MQNKANIEFVKKFEDFGKQPANIFALLGYEAGLALAAMFPLLMKGDAVAAVDVLNKKGVEGPRGLVSSNAFLNTNYYPIDIVKIHTQIQNTTQTILATETAFGFDTSDIIENTKSGWLNPYISV